jgi:hypothetical protein
MILGLLCFNSCKKSGDKNRVNNGTAEKVDAWLEKKKLETPLKSQSIDLLKNNIDISEARYESLNEEKQFLIIPIKENYRAEKRIDRNAMMDLVLLLDKTGKVLKGTIVMFIPDGKSPGGRLPSNAIYKVYNSKKIDQDGEFRFFSVTGKRLYEIRYKSGQAYSYSRLKKGPPKAASNGGSIFGGGSGECIDWYVVTSVYVDGVLVDQYEVYVGTTCGGCHDQNFASLCPDTGGGSSGGDELECCIPDPDMQPSSSVVTENQDMPCGPETLDPVTGNYIKDCTPQWTFNTNILLWYTWKVRSFESATLEKQGGVWKFRNLKHQGTAIDGHVPSCVSFNNSVNSSSSTILDDARQAETTLSFTNSFRVSCYPWSPPRFENGNAKARWVAG